MRFGLILGDQLHHQLATLKTLDRTRDVILMAEVVEEATYVAHHPQKIALIFSVILPKNSKQKAGVYVIMLFNPAVRFVACWILCRHSNSCSPSQNWS